VENSLSSKFTVGDFYTKSSLSDLIEEPNLKIVREGLYYCKKSRSTLFFVDLVKKNKPKKFHFNDKFEGEYFHWDSQTNTQWSEDTDGKIIEISNKRMGGDSKDSEENFNLEKPTISYYENGQKQIEGTYKDGEIISLKGWNEDGSVKE